MGKKWLLCLSLFPFVEGLEKCQAETGILVPTVFENHWIHSDLETQFIV